MQDNRKPALPFPFASTTSMAEFLEPEFINSITSNGDRKAVAISLLLHMIDDGIALETGLLAARITTLLNLKSLLASQLTAKPRYEDAARDAEAMRERNAMLIGNADLHDAVEALQDMSPIERLAACSHLASQTVLFRRASEQLIRSDAFPTDRNLELSETAREDLEMVAQAEPYIVKHGLKRWATASINSDYCETVSTFLDTHCNILPTAPTWSRDQMAAGKRPRIKRRKLEDDFIEEWVSSGAGAESQVSPGLTESQEEAVAAVMDRPVCCMR
jgi:hypothetical protein